LSVPFVHPFRWSPMTTTDAIIATAAEYGFTPDPELPVLYRRPDCPAVLSHTYLEEFDKHALSLWPSSVTHPDGAAAVHALMALCGIAKVEVAA